MKKINVLVVVLVAIVCAAGLAGTASGQVPTACGGCHAKYPSDSFDRYSDATPVSLLTCWPCHGNMVNHGTARVNTPYGAFATLESINLANPVTIAAIHDKHKNTNRWDLSFGCVNCHGGASCMACHPSPVPHGDHTVLGDGTNNYPGVRETYVIGRQGTTPPYTFDTTLTCTNGSCHGQMNTTFVARPSCTNCHAVDQTGHGDVEALHQSGESTVSCVGSGCHFSVNDIHEHENRALTCDTCHNNSDPVRAAEVRAAIDANNPRCSACHPLAAVPHHDYHEYAAFNASCQGARCHSSYLDTEHANRGHRCQVCHANPDPVRAATCEAAISGHDRRCQACHGAVGETGHYDIHEASPRLDDPSKPYGDFCFACHSNNLMDEHPRHRAADGSYMDCDTCHGVVSGPVADAIAAGNTRCDACHPVHGNVVAIHESPTTQRGNVIDGLECNECHKSNLATEHDKVGVLCSTCHDSGDATVLAAIDGADTTCMACHATYHAGAGTLSGVFSLNNGDMYTTTITVSANSAIPGATKMRLNAQGVWGEWIDYAETMAVTLSSAEGTKTVRAQYKDAANNFFDTSDTIILDMTPPQAPRGFEAANRVTSIDLSWANPAEDFALARIYRSTSGYADAAVRAPADQTVVYEGSGTSYADADVVLGTAYYYTARSRDPAGNWSAAATATARAQYDTTLAWGNLGNVTRDPVNYGGSVTFNGALATGSGPLADRADVQVWRSHDDASWAQEGTAVYDSATGQYRATRTVTANTYFELRFPGDASCGSCASSAIMVQGRAAVGMARSPSLVRRGRYFTLYGYMKPRHPSYVRVEFVRYVGGRWRTYATRYVRTSDYYSYSKWVYRYRVPYAGWWGIVVHHSDGDHVPSWSRGRYFRAY